MGETLRSFRRVAFIAALLASLLVVATPAQGAVNCSFDSGWGTNRPDLAQQVIDLTNQHRSTIGLGPLASSPTLTASAVWKSGHMAAHNYFDHTDHAFAPLTSQRSVADRIWRDCDYSGSGIGENIASGYTTAQAVMTGWLNSPGHRANIENGSYSAIGVGVVVRASGRIEWTQNFGTQVDAGSTPQPPPQPPPQPQPQPQPSPQPQPQPQPQPSPQPQPPGPSANPGEAAPLGASEADKDSAPLAAGRVSTLAVSGYKLRAAKVRAGKRFRARMVVRRKRGAVAANKLVVRCPAQVAGRRSLKVVHSKLRVVSQSRVQAVCVWRIPKNAAGARLKAGVVVGFKGDAARIAFGAKVRRG